MLIAIEGIDGAGTTTLAKGLVAEIDKNYQAIYTHEPWEDETNAHSSFKLIKQSIKDGILSSNGQALLFAANRKEHLDKVIVPALKQGIHVVCDRYILSSVAYQPTDATFKFNQQFRRPDITFLIDIDPAIALARMNERGVALDRFEKDLDFQVKVQQRYLEFSSIHPLTFILDGTMTRKAILESSLGMIHKHLDLRVS